MNVSCLPALEKDDLCDLGTRWHPHAASPAPPPLLPRRRQRIAFRMAGAAVAGVAHRLASLYARAMPFIFYLETLTQHAFDLGPQNFVY